MSGKPDLDNYVPVAQRIAQFRDRHPEGSLRPLDPGQPYQFVEVPNGDLLVVYVAAAWRTPDDPAPGVGCASEPYPGKTPYTKGSELMNAETSAWGRAIVAALAADMQHSVVSAEEVRNRGAERAESPGEGFPPDTESPEDRPGTVSGDQLQRIGAHFTRLRITDRDGKHALAARLLKLERVESARELSFSQAATLITLLAKEAPQKGDTP